MSPHAEPAPSTLDRIRRNLVGLKMPRALEVLEGTVRQIERGDITALEAIDALLSEELTLRQNRRVKMGLMTARITAAKTLAGFDFAFQPSTSSTGTKPCICSARPARAKATWPWRLGWRR